MFFMKSTFIGIMQPYFFPYLGYFSLIKHTDIFILLDEVQFIRHGWIERNRILKEKEGWVYIKAPLKKEGRSTLIKDCVLDNTIPWREKILSQCRFYKKIAPNYKEVMDLMNGIFSQDFNCITSLNKHVLTEICRYIGIECEFHVFSEMNLNIQQPAAADEWALNICQVMGSNITYVNPIGGMAFMDRKKYAEQGVDLYFHQVHLESYKQGYRDFEPGLSILDVLMFNSTDSIHSMLDHYELV
ncbi:WbqC-like protein family protein [Sphingobacterium lactis]|uniref:WbqC-like protein family protein n=2 Tax=Sphingobacterium lactis TaxID=797291 RepID=A0A1H6CKQ5_9SPHI|nr:WbqC-like protein family protein [Sphingobacterium lactis]